MDFLYGPETIRNELLPRNCTYSGNVKFAKGDAIAS